MDVEMVADSILDSPQGSEYGGEIIPAEASATQLDRPGPSSTFLPPSEHDHSAASASSTRPPGQSSSRPVPASPTLPPLADADDDDDEVLATLPVYISPSLGQNLALFQYPLQHRSLRVPQWAADRGKRITTRVKEGVGRVEVEVPIDADTRVWREDRARDIGFVPDAASASNGHREEEVGGEGKKKKKEKEAKWGDKMRLRSEAVPTKEGTYFSGLVHEGECEARAGGRGE